MRFKEFILETAALDPTLEQQQEMAKLYALGISPVEIGKKFGVVDRTIWKYLSRLPNYRQLRQQFMQARQSQGLSFGYKGTTPEQIQQIIKMFAAGQTMNKIAQQFQLTPATVHEHLHNLSNFAELKQQHLQSRKDQGLRDYSADRSRKGITPEQVQQMAGLWAQGNSLEQVGARFGIGVSSTRQHLKKLPNWTDLYQQNRDNRLKKTGGRQVNTRKMISKPMSQGNQAIRTTGPASGGRFE
jgi:DNA-binding CsgD family transcriptional regulator